MSEGRERGRLLLLPVIGEEGAPPKSLVWGDMLAGRHERRGWMRRCRDVVAK
jgi:hypothetical protein